MGIETMAINQTKTEENAVTLTVFTPTYNRVHLLTRCYESMKRQTDKRFIWLVVDDGSSDQTETAVKQWIAETTEFKIEYIYKENGGLHTAYNTAIAHIETELCVCIDSDDYMPEHAVASILQYWNAHGSPAIAGIVGLDYTEDGKVIGDPLPDRHTVNLIDLLIGKYHIHNGDRTNVVRTELYRRVAPMPVYPGEKNFNPHYMHLQISKEYDFLVLNENLRFVEYQSCGMSASMWKQYRNSPRSFAQTRLLYLSLPNAGTRFYFRHCIHYVSSCILSQNKQFLKASPKKLMTLLALPLGAVLTGIVVLKSH